MSIDNPMENFWSLKFSTLASQNKPGYKGGPAFAQLQLKAQDALAFVKSQDSGAGFVRLGLKSQLKTQSILSALETRVREVARNCRHLAVIGIGGSALGAQALIEALRHEVRPGSGRVSFLDNIDASAFWPWVHAQGDLGEIHWLIVSKSGTTLETLAIADFIDQTLRVRGHRRLSSVSTVVSESKDSPLMDWARKHSVPWLEIPHDVGGRYSVFTAAGLFPIAFLGIKADRVIDGAGWAVGQDQLVTDLAALALMSFERREWVTTSFAYCDGLRTFGRWWQQLWAESLAKRIGRNGEAGKLASTPVPAVGANDQHSILQQLVEGRGDQFVWFHRVKHAEDQSETAVRLERTHFSSQDLLVGKTLGELMAAEAEGTMRSLDEAGVPTGQLVTQALNEQSVGALLMMWQLAVAAIGFSLDLNPFDQPGVERGKVLAREILQTRS